MIRLFQHFVRSQLRSPDAEPAEWLRYCDPSLLAHLDSGERRTLASLAGRFVAGRSITGAGGLELSDCMRRRIAVEACLPILHLGLEPYAAVRTVIVYPSGFIVQDEWMDETGIVHACERGLSGSASDPGPVILAWDDVQQPAAGTNLIIHEFAHVLDAGNGDTNGFPPIDDSDLRRRWPSVFGAAYDQHCRELETTGLARIDAYAAENPAEFFAVATELFFAAPATLDSAYPEVFNLLARYFHQRLH